MGRMNKDNFLKAAATARGKKEEENTPQEANLEKGQPAEEKVDREPRQYIVKLPVEVVHNSAINKFSQHKDERYKEIIDGIKSGDGINNAIRVVRINPDEEYYTIISGHRRFMAAKDAGLKKVPCVIVDKDISDISKESFQLIRENGGNRKSDPFGFIMQAKTGLEPLNKTNDANFIKEQLRISDTAAYRIINLSKFSEEFLQFGQDEFFSFRGALSLVSNHKKDLASVEKEIISICKNESLSIEDRKKAVDLIINPPVEEPTPEPEKKEKPKKHAGGRPTKNEDAAEGIERLGKKLVKLQKMYKEHSDEQDPDKVFEELTALKEIIESFLEEFE